LGWSDNQDELAALLERRQSRQFSVLGWDGRRVGVFTVVGRGSPEGGAAMAIGSFAGVSPCQSRPFATGTSIDQECVAALGQCGLAVAELVRAGTRDLRPFEEDPQPALFQIGGACAESGKLFVDLDGDGRSEVFQLSDFLDSVRAPADELVALASEPGSCEPHFAAASIVPAGDTREWRGLDLLGVLDLDDDGRMELVLAFHLGAQPTWAVYSSVPSSRALHRVGTGLLGQ
jgi:hypothetical protein